ncbi:hypothetical protein FA95DRAFT_1504315, partial [Auriscalpium vulgare]
GLDIVKQIRDLTRIPQSTLYRIWSQYRTTVSVSKTPAVSCGRPRIILHHDAQYLLCLARYHPPQFLDEYAYRLEHARSLSVSLTTIHRTFTQAGLSVKRVQKLAKERSPLKRANYLRRIGSYSPVMDTTR